jgi:hypothetical protein
MLLVLAALLVIGLAAGWFCTAQHGSF